MAITMAPFLRARRTASRTVRFCPENETATATSPFRSKDADIDIMHPSSNTEVRMPMRKNLNAASRAAWAELPTP